jgi:HSP20 family protein
MSTRKKMPLEPADTWSYGLMWDHVSGCLEPLTEFYDKETELLIRIDMPCVKRKTDVEVKISEDTVTIEGKMSRVVQYEKWGTFQREAKFYRYSKAFTLPTKIDPEQAKARFKNGILELHLPKKERHYSIKVE